MAGDESTPATWQAVKALIRQFDLQLAARGIHVELPDDQPLEAGLSRVLQVVLQTLDRQTRQQGTAQAYAESIVATMREPLLMLDPAQQIVSANQAFYDFFQLTAEEVRGRALQHIDVAQLALPELQALLTDVQGGREGVPPIEVTRDFPRIGRRTLRVSARQIHPDPHESPRIVLVFDDLTPDIERELLYDELEFYATELETTLTALPDGLIIYDADGVVLHINHTAARWFGTPHHPAALTLDRVPLLTPEGEELPAAAMPGARALRGEEVRGQLLRLHTTDMHEQWVTVSAAPMRTVGGRLVGAVVTLTDVTALHALQQQQRGIIQMVSHDLRVPLTVLYGHLQLLKEEIDAAAIDGELHTSLTAADGSIRQMRVMIQDLVDAARRDGGTLHLDPQPIAVRTFVLDVLRRSRPVIEPERFQVQVSPAVPPVWADPDRLERILMNLLSNAAKYATPGTPVVIAAHPSESEVRIAVTDQGPGIAPQDLPYLFERFYRAKGTHKTEGIGLGLYITRTLVEAHGGRIWVESTVGEGSTFFFTLPVA